MSSWIVDYRIPGERCQYLTVEADSYIAAEMQAADEIRKMNLPEKTRIMKVYEDPDTVPDTDSQVLVSAQQSRHESS